MRMLAVQMELHVLVHTSGLDRAVRCRVHLQYQMLPNSKHIRWCRQQCQTLSQTDMSPGQSSGKLSYLSALCLLPLNLHDQDVCHDFTGRSAHASSTPVWQFTCFALLCSALLQHSLPVPLTWPNCPH